ncbi:asparagine synthase (glutamine-hydrolyzing) [Alicyclobacillus sp. SO9]|uniref:asparagine synthase (glutamine-hydrolyzing) n=1 Tax=Alicyclobacillus sp. SO9 TaxID=2665646 RepID=UPI0018E808B2|nr:asparagine synthase (glutamine-hydrolyzing) [Alicyclobacillus sp. SO9]QQE81036.1 asparagine synthase (glutamine-hydrolyzing) [Alicyclobacillus sp. SO9]
MCGFVGILNIDKSRPVQVDRLEAMSQEIIHRGPDEAGWYINGCFGMAFRRLSIIDINAGHQPFHNEAHNVHVVFNGEIYNYQSLRIELLQYGHALHSEADGEVISHLYEEHGISFIKRLRGMFAIAIYDEREDILYLIRDYFGIKPLYYSETAGNISFASEIKGLLKGRDSAPSISSQSLWDFLTYQYVPDPDSLFDGIYKIPPGSYLKFEQGKAKVERYFDPMFDSDESITAGEGIDGIQRALEDSVEHHSIADVPVGSLLSGGIDSSIIASLLADRQKELHTFTVGFEGGTQNEWDMAAHTARWLGTKHHTVTVDARDIMNEMERFVFHLDEPIADPSALGLYFVSKYARNYVKVLLSGEGADELFGGYPIYHEPVSLEAFNRMPAGVRQSLQTMAGLIPEGMKGRNFLLRAATPLPQRFLGNAKIFSEADKRNIVPGAAQFADSFERVQALYEHTKFQDDITRMQYVDMNTWLPGDILMKADKTTMAHSLELRVPFLDKEVFAQASKIPAHYRIAGGTTKWILRQAFQSKLPPNVFDRKKLGFATPTSYWISNTLKDYIGSTLDSQSAGQVLDKRYAKKLFDLHLAGKGDYSRKIWTIFVFIVWYETFMTSLKESKERTSVVN